MEKQKKESLEIPRSFDLDELVALKDGIVIESKGEENLYFEYKNELGHIRKGYYKF